jgi:hypothetical protein
VKRKLSGPIQRFDNKMKRIGIILIVAIALGLGYGCLSGILNQNPYYPVPGEYNIPEVDMAKAWHWQPSPVWLPSYLLCKVPRNGFGITDTRSGYLFRSEADRKTYFIASTIVGGIIGCLAGCASLLIRRKEGR